MGATTPPKRYFLREREGLKRTTSLPESHKRKNRELGGCKKENHLFSSKWNPHVLPKGERREQRYGASA